MLADIGYTDIEVEEVSTRWTPEDWEALSKYSVFIQGALAPNIDLAIGSEALIESAKTAYREMSVDTIERGWLHCGARRPH